MRLSSSVNLIGRCVTVCLQFSLWFALPIFTGSQRKGGAAIADPCRTRILHCYCMPTKLQMGLLTSNIPLTACFCLPLTACYCLPLTHLLTVTAYPLACYCLPLTCAAFSCCPCYCKPVLQTGPPTHVECGIAFAIAYPCRIRDCLHMFAFM